MPVPFLVQLAIGIGLSILAYALAPKPKPPKPPSLEDYKTPTAIAGRPIMVVCGSITVKGLNILGVHNKSIRKREVSVGSKSG